MVEIKPFKNQDYALLKSQHNASNLFVDPEFPVDIKLLEQADEAPIKEAQWKRPKVSKRNSNCGPFGYH
jgi:hypothetical protein